MSKPCPCGLEAQHSHVPAEAWCERCDAPARVEVVRLDGSRSSRCSRHLAVFARRPGRGS